MRRLKLVANIESAVAEEDMVAVASANAVVANVQSAATEEEEAVDTAVEA